VFHIPVHLVLVEDNPDESAMIIRELQREFLTLQVEQPSNFAELEGVLVEGNSELVITEYQLQWTTGIAVLETVKNLQPECPVIMFTRTGSEQIAVAALKAGLDDYIVKAPENYTSLTAGVRQVLLKARHKQLQIPQRSVSKGEDLIGQTPVNAQETQQIIATLEARVSQQAAIASFSQQALHTASVTALMDTAVTLVAETLKVEYAKVLELLPDEQVLLLKAGVGWQEGLVGQATVDAGANSQAGYTLLCEEPVIVEDLPTEPRFSGPPLLTNHGVISGMSVLIAGSSLAKQDESKNWQLHRFSATPQQADQPFGILGAHTTKHRKFTQDDINFLQVIANILTAAIKSYSRESRLQILERALDASSNGIMITDPNLPDNPIIYVNSGFERITGYSVAETLGRNCRFLQGSATKPQALAKLRRAITEATECRLTLRNYRQDGTIFWNDFHLSPVRDAQGKLTHFIGVQSDVTAQKVVNERLHQQAQLLDLANDAIIVREPEGTISYWNQGARRLYGFSVEEAVGNSTNSLLKTEFLQPLREIKAQLAEQGYWSGELVHTTRDGTKIHVSSRWTLQHDTQGNSLAILEINRNISEIKQAQKTQRQIQAQLKRLFESNLIGIIFADFSGSITEANDAFLEIVGYTREDLLAGRVRWKEMTPPEYDEADALSREQLRSTGVSTPFEKEYIRKDGTRIPVLLGVALLEGSQGDCVCFVLDLSERKRLEAALLNSIRRLQNLHAIDLAILAAKSPQETAGAALKSLRQLLPCPRLSVVVFNLEAQQGTLLAVHSDNKSTPIKVGTKINLEPFADLIEQSRQGKVCRFEQRETLPLSLPVMQACLAEGLSSFLSVPLIAQEELIGALNLWIDPTSPLEDEPISIAQEVADQLAVAIKQSQLQQQLVNYTSQLEKRVAERTTELRAINAELEAFSYSVSHDLRAPLRAMQGFGNALLEDCKEQLDSLGLEYTERIITAAQRLDSMIQDLLAYSRLGRTEIQLQPVSLESVVQEVLDQLEVEIKDTNAQITVGAKGLMPLPEILGHRATLIQVLLNLITNAIKFVPPSVQPQVQIWVEQRAVPDGRAWIRLWVEDNGIGIKPEYQEKIFKVFERLHGRESYSGSGIGLAIVRKGMERLGGDSGVESSIAQGSRFWIEGQKATKG